MNHLFNFFIWSSGLLIYTLKLGIMLNRGLVFIWFCDFGKISLYNCHYKFIKSSLFAFSQAILNEWWFFSFFLQKDPLELGELDWLTDIGLFGEEALAAAEVPQLPPSQPSNTASFKAAKSNTPYKKPRIEMSFEDEDEDFFTVPDLG